MLSRRALIGKAAVGAAAAVALGATRAGVASARAIDSTTDAPAGARTTAPQPDDAAANPTPPPWDLVRPLAAGAALGHGWRLVDLSPVQHGSCVATLENARGRAHRVHLCRNDGTPRGIVYTRQLDLVVMNEGHGDLPTEEGFGQAVAALAHVVARNEATAPEGLLGALLPHAERLQRFAAADGKLR